MVLRGATAVILALVTTHTVQAGSLCVPVLTQHNDNSRTGANVQETQLTVNNVGRPGAFGKLFDLPTDGHTYAQPLIACGVTPSAGGCSDVAPSPDFSCPLQASWGACGASWMQGFCLQSCGQCPGACLDAAPSHDYSCAQQASWGKCTAPWMQGFCRQSCGQCTGACLDVAPSHDYSCQQQVAWGKCSAPWMQGFCQQSCGQCTVASPRDIAVIATMNNSVYAYDANNGLLLWHLNVGPAVPVTVEGLDYHDIARTIGILSTPVVRQSDNSLYFVAVTYEPAVPGGAQIPRHRLYRVDLLTGQHKTTPTIIAATYPGRAFPWFYGPGNNAITFNSTRQAQRPALLLSNNTIYMAFGSFGDQEPFFGWIMAYGADTLQQWGVFVVAPDSGDGGVWQSGNGLMATADGSVFAVTGNGNGYDGVTPNTTYEHGCSVIKLRLTQAGLTTVDFFTPHNWASLDELDADMGVSGLAAVPGTNPPLGVTGSKDGRIFVVNLQNLGGLQPDDAGVVQIIPPSAHPLTSRENHIHGSPVTWAGPDGIRMFVWPENDYAKAFALYHGGGTFDVTPQSTSSVPDVLNSMPGGILSLSSNGNQWGSGILWASLVVQGDALESVEPGILRAFDATDLTRELWNSRQNTSRDSLGSFAKFSAPTVSGGKVYIGNFCQDAAVASLPSPCRVTVYGLL